jgi:hypothetical protein
MKLLEKPINVVESEKFESVSFGIKQSGLPYIFNILRNQLYSNKPLAVLREVSCNAQDANIEAKSKRPFEVKLPTKLDPTLTIRDFGNGLSSDDIKNLYCFYGESTKRESNSAIGYYGIGKFAPFSYGDNFVLVSYHKGVKTTYNAFIDETKIGKIVKLKEEKSSEPSGVEISVPVKEEDTQTFLSTAQELFKYFKSKPLIKGARKEDLSEVYDRTPVFKGNGWAYYKNSNYSHESVAIMGVGYPIETSDVQFKEDCDEQNICSQGFEVEFDLGELDITASRENLEYTEKTKKAIRDKFRKIKKEMAESISQQFKDSTNVYDAKSLYNEVFGTYGSLGYIVRNSLSNKVTWNNKTINDNHIDFNDKIAKMIENGKLVSKFYQKSRRSTKLNSENEDKRILCEKTHKILVNDTGSAMGVTHRLATLWNELGDKIDGSYVFTFADKATKDSFDKELGLIESNYLNLSAYEKITIQKINSGTSVVTSKNPKHSSQIFKFNRKNANNYGTKSSNWETMTMDFANDTAIYVEISNFQAQGKDHEFRNGTLKDIIEKYEGLTGEKLPDIYGIKSKTFESKKKIITKNKNLTSLWKHLEDGIRKEYSKLSQQITDKTHWDKHTKEDNNFADVVQDMHKKSLHELIQNGNSEFAQYLSAIMFYAKSNFKKVGEALEFLKLAEIEIKFDQVNSSYDLDTLLKSVRNKYEVLDVFVPHTYGWHYNSKPEMTKILNYINLVDKN